MRNRDFEEAIRWEVNSSSQCKMMDYQPGNGSRYVIVFTQIPVEPAAPPMPRYPLGWLVALADGAEGGKCAVFVGSGWLSRSYVKEKLRLLSNSDVAVLTEIIGFVIGRPAPEALDRVEYVRRIQQE